MTDLKTDAAACEAVARYLGLAETIGPRSSGPGASTALSVPPITVDLPATPPAAATAPDAVQSASNVAGTGTSYRLPSVVDERCSTPRQGRPLHRGSLTRFRWRR